MAQIEGKEFLIMRESDLYAVIRRTKIDTESPQDSPKDSPHIAVPLDHSAAETVYVLDQNDDPDQQDWEFEMLAAGGNRYQVSIRRTGVT